jgi:hypothetical protein
MASWIAATKAAATKAPAGLLLSGSAVSFVAIAVFGILVWLMVSRARSGQALRPIRRLTALDAIDEVIGRSTEMGQPVHYTMGLQGITDSGTIASLPVLGYVAGQCARYDTRLIQTSNDPIVYALVCEIIQQAYLEAGRPEAYNPDDVRFLTQTQFAYTAGVFEVLQRERPGAQVLFGDFFGEALMIIEAGAAVGAVQIGATQDVQQVPFFVAGCDYYLIGEEMYAASAYLSHDPLLTGTIVAEDLYKFLIFALIVAGVLAVNLGLPGFATFLKNV